MARVLGRADKEQLCVLGQDWERKGLEAWWQQLTALGQAAGPTSGPHILLPTYGRSQPEGYRGTTSPHGCVAMDKLLRVSEPQKKQSLLLLQPWRVGEGIGRFLGTSWEPAGWSPFVLW